MLIIVKTSRLSSFKHGNPLLFGTADLIKCHYRHGTRDPRLPIIGEANMLQLSTPSFT